MKMQALPMPHATHVVGVIDVVVAFFMGAVAAWASSDMLHLLVKLIR